MIGRLEFAKLKVGLFCLHAIRLKKVAVLRSKDSMVGLQASLLPIRVAYIALRNPKTVLARANTILACWERIVYVIRILARMLRPVLIRDAQPRSVA